MEKKRIIFLAIVLSIIVVVVFTFILLFNGETPIKYRVANINITENDLDIVYGSDSALLTVFIYSSYNCVFCRKFFTDVFPVLKREYIDKNKVKLVVKLIEFSESEPITESLKIAVCINKYGNFTKLHKLLLADNNVIYTQEFKEVIEEFIDKDTFVAECMLSGKAEEYIIDNVAEFRELELTGTPSIIINNKIVKGYRKFEVLKDIIENELMKNVE